MTTMPHIRQDKILLDHFKGGNYISWLQSRVDPFNMANVHSVIRVLRQKGHEIGRVERVAERSGRRFSAYYLSAQGVTPELPEKFPEDELPPEIPVASDRAVDYVATVLSRRTSAEINGDPSYADATDTALQADGELLERARTREESRETLVPEIEMLPEPEPEVQKLGTESVAGESQRDTRVREADILAEEGQHSELRLHHVANPGDKKQILDAFRRYCSQFGGKRVPITHDWARLVLTLNINKAKTKPGELVRNRKIRRAKLEKFKSALRLKKLHYTNDAVCFDTDGMLVNGQTRLTASVETGLMFEADVTFDLSKEAFPFIDTRESARTPTEIATMLGVAEYANVTAAAASHLYRKDKGLQVSQRLTHVELSEALATYHDIGASVARVVKIGLPGPKSIYAAVHYLASRINAVTAEEFFSDISSGANLSATDPALVLRNRILLSFRKSSNEFSGGPGQKRFRAALCRTFKLHLERKDITRLVLEENANDWL